MTQQLIKTLSDIKNIYNPTPQDRMMHRWVYVGMQVQGYRDLHCQGFIFILLTGRA